MRDQPVAGPSAQQALARMYAQRVPSRPKQIGRMPEQQVDQPWWKDALGALGTAGKMTWAAVASPFATVLDPIPGYEPENSGTFNLLEQGGKSLEHVAGDAYQLGRSILTGKDTLSESPTARAYQQAGGGVPGVFAGAMPYVDVATAVYPFAKAATPAGALAIERAAGEAASSRALAEGIANARPTVRPQAALAEEMARAANNNNYLGTIRKQTNTLSTDEFPSLSSVGPRSGGLPDETLGSTQQLSWPVYNVGDQQFIFGPTRVGRFDPPVNLSGINRLPINPYAITGQAAESPLGQQYAELFFDALHGYGIENGANAQMGMVPALLKAASSGDDVALRELQRFAEVGKKSFADARLQQTLATTSSNPIDVIVGKDAIGNSVTRPIETQDIFVVHQTQYKPTVDAQGNVIIRPPKDYGIGDEITGKPLLDPITGDPVSIERNSVHFALNHLVGGNTGRSVPMGRSYIVISPLDDVLKANPGALDNLYAVDSFMTPEPGKGLVVPMSSGRIIEVDGASQFNYSQPKGNPFDWSPEQQATYSSVATNIDSQAAMATQDALQELGKQRFGEGYETRIFERGDAYSSPEVDSSVARLAAEQIGRDFPEYGGYVPSTRHNAHPFSHYERMLMPQATTDPHLLRNIYEAWMFSPNAKRRFFNNDLFTTASTKLSHPDNIL